MNLQELQLIESLRGKYDSASAELLKNIARQHNGPTNHGCFCKTGNITTYINQFYTWYESLQKTPGQADEE